MQIKTLLPILFVSCTLGSATLHADELVEAAKRERARREALQKKKDKEDAAKGKVTKKEDKEEPPKVLSNADLKKAGGNAAVSEITPHNTDSEDYAEKRAEQRQGEKDEEAVWREKLDLARDGVKDAEKHVMVLKDQLAEARRQAAVNASFQASQMVYQLEADIPKAEQAVKAAEKAVDGVREQARKAGVAPGVMR